MFVARVSSAAEEARALVERGTDGSELLWRFGVLQLLDDYESTLRHEGLEAAERVFAEAPPLTGHSGLDASFAALACWLATRDGWQAPDWARDPPHLRVCVAGAEHPLAMKVASSRVEQDRDDLELLIRTLGITSAEQALDMARQCLGPTYPIPPRAQYLLAEICEG